MKIKREKEREKDLRAVTVEGMKEGARASLFRKLKKGRNGHSGVERKRERQINVKGEEDRKNVMVKWYRKERERKDLVRGRGNCTQSAFRKNVLMHWNSLLESATTALVIGTSPLAS